MSTCSMESVPTGSGVGQGYVGVERAGKPRWVGGTPDVDEQPPRGGSLVVVYLRSLRLLSLLLLRPVCVLSVRSGNSGCHVRSCGVWGSVVVSRPRTPVWRRVGSLPVDG